MKGFKWIILLYFAVSSSCFAQSNDLYQDSKPALTNYPGFEQSTAHQWLTWRRCLYEFTPLLFH